MNKALASVLLLSACAAQPPHTDEQRRAADTRMMSMINCARAHAKQMDDGKSDASTIALALAGRCNTEYVLAMQASAAAILDNDQQRDMFMHDSAKQSRRVEYFLPYIIESRKNAN